MYTNIWACTPPGSVSLPWQYHETLPEQNYYHFYVQEQVLETI